ncbi:MAG: hypothetical protein K2Q26_06560 [Bdellovibrionales bacterium]|nr:hypothetical protein [Bdellovibrionales bacterium]
MHNLTKYLFAFATTQLLTLSAQAATPFINLFCASYDSTLHIDVEADESARQTVVVSLFDGTSLDALGQSIYDNFKKDQYLSLAVDANSKSFSMSVGFYGKHYSSSTVAQIVALPKTATFSLEGPVIKGIFDAVAPAHSTYLPIPYSEPMSNRDPFDGQHQTNSSTVLLRCKLEMIQ